MTPATRLILSLAASLYGLLTASLAQPNPVEFPPATEAILASGFDGTLCLYDLKTQTYRTNRNPSIDTPRIPASTFKIFSSLVALETGVIDSREATIEWDGNWNSRTELNRDLTLQSAFRLSAVPHYQELVRRIGPARMQRHIDAVGYGNRDISGGDDSFWLTGALRITPRQQIEFLTRLYSDDLPFSPETMAAVRAMMLVEETASYKLRAKTGLAILEGDRYTGWWVGWGERKAEVTFFATVLDAQSPDETFAHARIAITREALALPAK
ncbi:Penicillin binding protein transpeptidase domain, putative [Verrucomicrobiia bacterium DG1235]|nr:Penicillin binding protein transpeptidase domain, putative [Verrucomicrobiae bacterium DG1235]